MALQTSGQIALSDVNTELGNAAGTSISMGGTAVRDLFNIASGEIQMSDGYGKSAAVPVAAIRYNEFSSGSAVDTIFPDNRPVMMVTNGATSYSNSPINTLTSMRGGVGFGNKDGKLAVFITGTGENAAGLEYNTVHTNSQCMRLYKGTTAISKSNSQATTLTSSLVDGRASGDYTFTQPTDQWDAVRTVWLHGNLSYSAHIATVDANNSFPDKDETWELARITCVYGTVQFHGHKVRLVISNNTFTMYAYTKPTYSNNNTCDSTLCGKWVTPTTSDLYYTLSWTWNPSTSRFSGTNFTLISGWTGQAPSSSRHSNWYNNSSYYTPISYSGTSPHNYTGKGDSNHKFLHPYYNADHLWMGESE